MSDLTSYSEELSGYSTEFREYSEEFASHVQEVGACLMLCVSLFQAEIIWGYFLNIISYYKCLIINKQEMSVLINVFVKMV